MRLENRLASVSPQQALVSLLSAAAITFTPSSAVLAAALQSDTIERVVDGDTVVLSSIGRARLIGINTPETVSPAQRQRGEPPQCFGPEASEATKKLLPSGTAVSVESDVDPKDRFGRSLVYLYTKDGASVNELLVKQGFARAKAYKPNVAHRAEFEAAEATAKSKGIGLWGKCVDANDGGGKNGAGKGFGPSSKPVIATASDAAKPARPAKTQAEVKQREQQQLAASVIKPPLTNPGDVKNCKDFATYKEAKAYYDLYFPQFGDVAKLDGNGDGIPCEALLQTGGA